MDEKKGTSATRAKNKYNSQKYDSIRIMIPKGQKPEIAAVANAAGESLNGFITKAIADYTVRYRYSSSKVYTIIGGVNGTGKSTFTGAQKNNADFAVVLDVDKITALNRVFPLEGGKMALNFIQECLIDGISFAQETTLSGQKTESTAVKAKELGYSIKLYYIGLDTPEESLKRISNRVARGGHDIGEVDVRRRFSERWRAVKKILPYCDEATFFDNDNGFVEVAEYFNGEFILKDAPNPEWIIELSDYLRRNKMQS